MTAARDGPWGAAGGACASAWTARLLRADTPAAVALTLVKLARAQPDCVDGQLFWQRPQEVTPERAPSTPADALDEALVHRLWAQPAAGELHADSCLALRLPVATPAALLLRLAPGSAPAPLIEALREPMELAAVQLQRLLELDDLQQAHRRLSHSGTLQQALFEISELSVSQREMPELLRGIHAIVNTLMLAENLYIVRYSAAQDTLRFLYYADVKDTDTPEIGRDFPFSERATSLTGHLIRGGRALMGSPAELQRQVEGPLTLMGADCEDWLGVPMKYEGEVGGALVVQTYEPGVRYNDEDRSVLEFVAAHVLTALARKQGQDELEQRVRRRTLELAQANHGLQLEVAERQRAEQLQAALFQLAALATEAIAKGEFYRRVHEVVGALLNAENFFIALLSDDRQRLDFPYLVDERTTSVPSRTLGRGLSEYVLRHGQPLIGGRADIDALAQSGEVALADPSTRALCWLGVPLRVGEQVIGVVVVQSYSEQVSYSASDQELLSFAALQIANSIYRRRAAAALSSAYGELEQRVSERTLELQQQIMQRERMQAQLRHQVMHDPLTGLPNRACLRSRIDAALQRVQLQPGSRCALLYLDVDRFKIINDSLGHLAGDRVLREVATRLLSCIRDPDMVARLSGDEFAILLEDVPEPALAMAVAQRVLDALAQPLALEGRNLQPTASVGVAMGDLHYRTADDLLRDADLALYRAKAQGRKRYALFDEAMARDKVDELSLEGELRTALEHDQFEPYFQPIVRLTDDTVVGYEALLRWRHPQRGVLAPDAFLKMAQEGGYLEAIDWQLFERAIGQLLQLPDTNVYLTINVCALHLAHADFDARLLNLLGRAGLPSRRLVLEVTEGSLLGDPDLVRSTLERLRRAGVGAALDDFGTGYSSLSYLHSLPLTLLKIDRSFVQALDGDTRANSNTVVAAVLALARTLGMQVVAEGIETPGQRVSLAGMGCELGQGFSLGRPAPLAHWLPAA